MTQESLFLEDNTHLQADWETISRGPADIGVIALLVRRLANEGRETPESLRVSVEDAVDGDRWSASAKSKIDAQVSLINAAVARRIAQSDEPERLAQFGDNIHVDLDLSAANLPEGTQLRCGDVLLEVTSEAHLGCGKFARRFGNAALALVNEQTTRELKLRGIYARVLRSGEMRVGDQLEKVPSDQRESLL